MMAKASREVVIEWDSREVKRFTADPNGDLALQLFRKLADIVLLGAKRRALVRTGEMRNEMTTRIMIDEQAKASDSNVKHKLRSQGQPGRLWPPIGRPKNRHGHGSGMPETGRG